MILDLIKKYKVEGVLLVISLFAHFFIFFLLLRNYGSESYYITNIDAVEYFYLGKNLYQHHVFSEFTQAPFYLNSFRTVLYPLYLALFQFFSVDAWLPIVFQNIIASFSIVLIYRLGLLVVDNKKISFVAALVFALSISQNFWANNIEPDTLLVFLILISLILFIKYVNCNSRRYLYWSAFILGLAALAKPVAIYFPLFILGYIFIYGVIIRRDWKHFIQTSAIYLAIVFMTILPWALRNWSQLGVFGLSSIQGVNLLYYAESAGPYPPELCNYLDQVKQNYGFAGQGGGDGHRDIRATAGISRLALKAIIQHPLTFAKRN